MRAMAHRTGERKTQPFFSADGRIVVLFNGVRLPTLKKESLSIKRLGQEIYNWRQLSQAAAEQGEQPLVSVGASSAPRTGGLKD